MINASPDPQPPQLARSQHGSLNGEWQLFPASTFSAAKRRCLLPVLQVHTNTLDDCLSLLARAFSTWLIAACREGVRGGVRCWGVGGNHKISGDCIWCCHIAGSLISSWCHVIELLLWRSVPLAVHYSELCLISPRSDSQRYLREHVEHSLPAASVLVKPPDVPPNDIPPFYLFPRDRWVTGSQRAGKHGSWKPVVICTGGCALCHSPAQTCRQCWKEAGWPRCASWREVILPDTVLQSDKRAGDYSRLSDRQDQKHPIESVPTVRALPLQTSQASALRKRL